MSSSFNSTSSLPLLNNRAFRAVLIIVLAASSLAAVTPRAHASSSNAQYAGPPLSGIFQSASDFAGDTAPGIGTVTMATCTDGTDLGGGNIRINCDSTNLPHNEMSIAVDPTNPSHIIAGSNDYELFFVGGFIVERIIAGYYTSFDHGKTWLNGHIDPDGFTFNGDPAVAFNTRLGLVHYGTVNFNAGQGGGFATPSVLVSTSSDGGKTFGHPVVVALGMGGTTFTVFNDKPYIIVDNNPNSAHFGRLYVSWTRFTFDQFGRYISSPIFLAFSDDGGQTFSAGQEISGASSTLCANSFNSFNAGICNEDQFSAPVVGPDGTLYVAFENDQLQGAPEFRNQYLVVRSTDGGQTFQGPFQAAGPIFDGTDDYPININGRQTLSNSQFRVNSAGTLAVDPSSGPTLSSTRLYIAFSDNRNGMLTGSFKTVVTNTDVFVVTSSDGGATWGSVTPVLKGDAAQNDQFYPWTAVDSKGVLNVAFSDRSFDPNNIKYGETLAISTNGGTSFSHMRVDTGLSNPDDSRWFTNGGQTNGKATFIGDYNGLAVGSDRATHPIWTDMRTSAFPNPPPGRGHNTQDAVTADPSPAITLTSTVTFDGVQVTTSVNFNVDTSTMTLTGTATVTVVNATTMTTIFSKSFTISLVFGTSLGIKFILSAPTVPLSLAASCTVSIIAGSATCIVSRNPDINLNGSVDAFDLSAMLASFGATAGSTNNNPAVDLNANGTVDAFDLSILLADFGAPVF